ncbi:hypothetical protein [Bacillus cereus]|uniref:hypothetical protein n=1 Tax=Bacillus cereus group TaxID=86661 RepID=UPI000976108C|nr:hypothetical protein [Bacillus cereus]MBF8118923.1 hypothetical protein [Bacillus cereus]ONG72119.1 hypothetical protein BKK44_10040 [Bacillus cereus]
MQNRKVNLKKQEGKINIKVAIILFVGSLSLLTICFLGVKIYKSLPKLGELAEKPDYVNSHTLPSVLGINKGPILKIGQTLRLQQIVQVEASNGETEKFELNFLDSDSKYIKINLELNEQNYVDIALEDNEEDLAYLERNKNQLIDDVLDSKYSYHYTLHIPKKYFTPQKAYQHNESEQQYTGDGYSEVIDYTISKKILYSTEIK